MRVPVYDEQQVQSQSVGLPLDSPHAVSDAGLQQGLASLDRAGAAILAGVKHTEDKAIAAEVTDSETKFTRKATGELHGDSATGKKGFLSLQGRAAEADGATVMERIEKHRQDIANGLANDEAKKLFLERTGKQVESLRSSVESHVSGERQRADVASLNARADAATEAMSKAARVGDGATVQLQSMALEGSIRALALSPEDADRDVAKWRRHSVATQIDAFLDVKRLDVAEALLNDAKDTLGPELAKKYQTEIDTRKVAVTAESAADQIVAKSQQAVQNRHFAAPDRATAEQLLSKLPADVQKKAAPLVKERLVLLDQQADEERKKFLQDARAAYNRNRAGFFATPMADRLNDVDSALYDTLSERAERRAEHLQRKRANNSQAKAQQKLIDNTAVNEWTTKITTNPNAADLEDFLTTHDDLSDDIPSRLEAMKAKAVAAHAKGAGQSIGEFSDAVLKNAERFLPKPGATPKSKAIAKQARDDLEARAKLKYLEAFEQNQGKELDPAKAADLRATLVEQLQPNADPESVKQAADAIVRRGTGGPPTGGKRVKSYLVSPDKKRRIPVYADGTRGAEESVP